MSAKFSSECANCIQVKELEVLLEISRHMSRYMELEKKLGDGLKLLRDYLMLERCTVYRLDADKQELFVLSSVDLTFKQKMMATYKVGEGATGVAAQSREPVVIENIHNDMLFLNKTGARNTSDISYVAVPMIAGEEVVGVLAVNLTKRSSVNFEETIKILTIVSSIFAQSILLDESFKTEKSRLVEQNDYYKKEVMRGYAFDSIVGENQKMKDVFSVIGKIAPSKATVLIRGETGTGKELIASAIHNASPRKDGPFVKLNCAAIPENLLESELFGHEKGAFTDAKEMRKGRFELSDGGTLFLDEIGDISSNLQVRLLRVLQEQEFERVGGNKVIKTDVRVVAATNRNLEEMVENGEFREDLFYRLNVIPINLPPLRERGEDALLLIHHFIDKFSKIHKKELTVTQNALRALLSYTWPGNIRELENTMERIVLLCDGDIVDEQMIALMLPQLSKNRTTTTPHTPIAKMPEVLTKNELQRLEKGAIVTALSECRGVQAKAAKKLGLTTRQIGYKILKYEIDVDDV